MTRFDHTWTDMQLRARVLERERAAKKASKKRQAAASGDRRKR